MSKIERIASIKKSLAIYEARLDAAIFVAQAKSLTRAIESLRRELARLEAVIA